MICASCSATHDSGSLCPKCIRRIEELLRGLHNDIADLDTTLTRQTRTGTITAARSAERALPYDPAASDVAADVRSFLVGWVQAICRASGDWPATTETALIQRLQREHWPIHPQAADFLDELEWTREQILRAVDRRPDRRFMGPCTAVDENGPCGGAVWQVGSRQPMCQTCRSVYDRDERAAWLHQAASDRLVSASDGASALTAWGTAGITSGLIRQWASRGRIAVRAHDQRNIPLYRFGDIALVAATRRSPS